MSRLSGQSPGRIGSDHLMLFAGILGPLINAELLIALSYRRVYVLGELANSELPYRCAEFPQQGLESRAQRGIVRLQLAKQCGGGRGQRPA